MPERFAFTAKYWGRRAVVCRAVEDRPGPMVVQEFGQFASWTQANTFARKLNEGLDIDVVEANRIVTASELRTSDLMRAVDSMEASSQQSPERATENFLRAQFALAQLELALTFCRLVSCNPGRRAGRLVRNARNALFNAMHALVYCALAEADTQRITDKMALLVEALQEISPRSQDAGEMQGMIQEAASAATVL